RADIQLELAGALQASDPSAAVAECRAALAIFDRTGAQQAADRTAALLRSLGVTSRSRAGATNEAGLSRRERDVLELLREGLSNAEIGRRLFITPKTAEHHVGAILGKLNMRTRAEAAVFAASQRDRCAARRARLGGQIGGSPDSRQLRLVEDRTAPVQRP